MLIGGLFFLRGYWRTYFDNTLSIFFDQLGTLFADNSTYFFQITIDFYLHVNSTKALAEMGTELGFFFETSLRNKPNGYMHSDLSE